jgi:hypothetical protein
MERREFLQVAAAAGFTELAAELLGTAEAAVGNDQQTIRETVHGDMRYRQLGRTGVEVSAIGLGGYHSGVPKDENESIKIIRTAIDAGITFLDNSWDYHDGGSEVRMGTSNSRPPTASMRQRRTRNGWGDSSRFQDVGYDSNRDINPGHHWNRNPRFRIGLQRKVATKNSRGNSKRVMPCRAG